MFWWYYLGFGPFNGNLCIDGLIIKLNNWFINRILMVHGSWLKAKWGLGPSLCLEPWAMNNYPLIADWLIDYWWCDQRLGRTRLELAPVNLLLKVRTLGRYDFLQSRCPIFFVDICNARRSHFPSSQSILPIVAVYITNRRPSPHTSPTKRIINWDGVTN